MAMLIQTASAKLGIGRRQAWRGLCRAPAPGNGHPDLGPMQSTFKALLLTHIHIDHSGLIPKFVHEGFAGPILATRPTVDLADIVLRDSAHIQGEDAAYKRKRHQREGRQGKHPEEPLYTMSDVEQALVLFQGVEYGQTIPVADGIDVIFRDAGHILGSAMLEFLVKEGDRQRRVVFSGDIGQRGKPLIGDPSFFGQADYVIMESTYGDRLHDESGDVETQLCEVINETIKRGGNVIIPTFAIERAQELMYYIGRLVYAKRIPSIPIFLDSPMAVDVTEIFRHNCQYLDPETQQLIMSKEPPLRYAGLRLVHNVEQSKAINHLKTPCTASASQCLSTKESTTCNPSLSSDVPIQILSSSIAPRGALNFFMKIRGASSVFRVI